MTDKDKLAQIQSILSEPSDSELRNVYTDWTPYPNFKPAEFVCPCGKCSYSKASGVQNLDEHLLTILQYLRNKYGIVQITSGARCTTYNNGLKGAVANSYHTKLKAADFYISGVTNYESKREAIVSEISKFPNFKYAYHNKSGKYPNMGNAVHVEVK